MIFECMVSFCCYLFKILVLNIWPLKVFLSDCVSFFREISRDIKSGVLLPVVLGTKLNDFSCGWFSIVLSYLGNIEIPLEQGHLLTLSLASFTDSQLKIEMASGHYYVCFLIFSSLFFSLLFALPVEV
jgi:hypothetical protein